MFCSSELIELQDKKWEDYYCNNCLCSYKGKDIINIIYFDFNSNLELNVPLDGDMDAYPIGIKFYIKTNIVYYNDWALGFFIFYENMTISSVEEAKDLVKRIHNLKLFI
jgi:hypothetical protein